MSLGLEWLNGFFGCSRQFYDIYLGGMEAEIELNKNNWRQIFAYQIEMLMSNIKWTKTRHLYHKIWGNHASGGLEGC